MYIVGLCWKAISFICTITLTNSYDKVVIDKYRMLLFIVAFKTFVAQYFLVCDDN